MFLDFLIVNKKLTYNAVLAKPVLKGLKAITFIHHLAMKFHIEAIVATIKGPQESDLNSICKATSRLDVNCIMILDVEMVKTIMDEAPIYS